MTFHGGGYGMDFSGSAHYYLFSEVTNVNECLFINRIDIQSYIGYCKEIGVLMFPALVPFALVLNSVDKPNICFYS